MPSNTPLHGSETFNDADVSKIALDSVNEIVIKPIGGDIYIRLDGADPSAHADDWFIPNGVPETLKVGHSVTFLRIIGAPAASGTVKVYGSRFVQDN